MLPCEHIRIDGHVTFHAEFITMQRMNDTKLVIDHPLAGLFSRLSSGLLGDEADKSLYTKQDGRLPSREAKDWLVK
jgi:hypothetical protein